MNPSTGQIFPQFHVVFDGAFSIITSIGNDGTPPSFCNEIAIDEFIYTLSLDDNSEVTLSDRCPTHQEREEKERSQVKATKLCSRIQPDSIPLSLALLNTATKVLSSLSEDLQPVPTSSVSKL